VGSGVWSPDDGASIEGWVVAGGVAGVPSAPVDGVHAAITSPSAASQTSGTERRAVRVMTGSPMRMDMSPSVAAERDGRIAAG